MAGGPVSASVDPASPRSSTAGGRPTPLRAAGQGLLRSLDPAAGHRLSSYRRSLADGAEARVKRAGPGLVGGGKTVGVIGLSAGEGRSTVTALVALVAAGYAGRRVAVIDTPAATFGRTGDRRTVTEMLGGKPSFGRLDRLLAAPADEPVSRELIRSATTPGTAVPVVGLSPRNTGFPPQVLEQTLARLAYRADLVLIDTPPAAHAPVLHAVLDSVDHLLLVIRDDRDVQRRLAAVHEWLRDAPGRRAFAGLSIALVDHAALSRFTPRRSDTRRLAAETGVRVVPFSVALRRGRPGGPLGSGVAAAGLDILADVLG